ncbi:MAG: type IX secretion system membrane protein PorP/SprF [Raineya sp.]|nr:type IX secretion system membrane protein PorP/SprF [Raineya sp.]
MRLFIVFWLIVLTCSGQDFRYNFYQYNAVGVNPAWAGMQEQASLSYHSRRQNLSVSNHTTLMLTAMYPILHNEKHFGTLGLSLFQDRQGFLGEVNAFELLAACNVPLHEKHKIYLALGLQGGSREIYDALKGTDYFPAWSGGIIFYQRKNSYQNRWFAGVSQSNWLGNERYLENYQFFGKLRTILIAGFEVAQIHGFAIIPNVRSILQKDVNFTNYGVSLRKTFSDNSGAWFRYGSWGISGWYAPIQGFVGAVDIDTPAFTLGFSLGFSSQEHFLSYGNSREFIVSLKKIIGKKRLDEKPLINETEPNIE